MAKQLEKKHSLAKCWLHWVNFPLLAMMIWSGLLIYRANAVYAIKIFGYELFHFFPAWFYETLGLPFRLAEGLQLHLTMEHGAPLRLVTPTKYGIKQIKRIGRIGFTSERPADYRAERGYDWYSGH